MQVRLAYQFPTALVGIAITGEGGETNWTSHADLEIHRLVNSISASSSLNLPSVSRLGIHTGLDGTRTRSTEQPIYHRHNPFLQG